MLIETGIQYALMFTAILVFAGTIPLAFLFGDKYDSPGLAGIVVLIGWGCTFLITGILRLTFN